jgi:hypothetical protein
MHLAAGFPLQRSEFDPRSGHVRFMTDKASLGQVFAQYFGFPANFRSNNRSILIDHPVVK